MNDLIDRFNAVPLPQKAILLGIIVVGLFVACLMLEFQPIDEEIEQLANQEQTLRRELSNLEGVRRNQAEVAAELDELRRRLEVAREQLPERAEIPSLLQRIHGQAQTVGLSIERFRRNEDVPRSDFIEIPVEMELVGTFDEVTNFFFFVGRMTRIVNIRDITLRRSGSGLTPDGQLVVTAQATTYRWNPR